jgi:hypothetical protein
MDEYKKRQLIKEALASRFLSPPDTLTSLPGWQLLDFAKALGEALEHRDELASWDAREEEPPPYAHYTCDHTFAACRQVLREMGFSAEEAESVVENFRALGAHCSCEVAVDVICGRAGFFGPFCCN